MIGDHRDGELERVLQQALDDGNSVWVIGDIHGHLETFQALIERLNLSKGSQPIYQKKNPRKYWPSPLGDHVICLGDLIDRGPDSLGVLRFVEDSENIHSIRGNHDEMLRLSVSPKHGKMMKSWLKYGGVDTLQSFSDDPDEQIEIAKEWLPFIESLPTELVLNNHRLVHGGYDIKKDLEEQNNQDRMFSRSIFSLEVAIDSQRQVIVGHTTVQALSRDIDGVWASELEKMVLESGIWASDILLDDGRPAVMAIDTGIYLSDEELPRLTALNLLTGEVVSQPRVESVTLD
jgi:serine/threonine protein phosphatase 1